MSRQFKQAVAWWLRAKDLQVKEVLDVKVEDTRGWSAETGEWGSEDVEVTYLTSEDIRQRHSEEVNFAAFVSILADTDWEGATAELAAAKAEKERLEQAKREAHAQFQRDLEVALFDGDAQVSDWTSFAEGKIPVPDGWVKQHNFSANTGPRLKLMTKTGAGVSSANASVREIITKAYAITWRTVW
jgi:hypothetical protein